MDTQNKSRRISNDKTYVKPKKTLQEKMTIDEINAALEDYVQVDDISTVPLKSHLRYYITENGVKKFRLGGFLSMKEKPDEYVILTNNKLSWSVDTKKATFFKKMTVKDIKEEFSTEIKSKDARIEKLMKMLRKLKSKIETLTGKTYDVGSLGGNTKNKFVAKEETKKVKKV